MKPCWKALRTGYLYVDKEATPGGITKLALRAGAATAKIVLAGKGTLLDLPALGNAVAPPLVVELRNTTTGTCWSATYDAPFVKNDGVQLKARSD